MQSKSRVKDAFSGEPIGIVIADGGTPPIATRFSAYVWGPVPDEEDESSDDVFAEASVEATAAAQLLAAAGR